MSTKVRFRSAAPPVPTTQRIAAACYFALSVIPGIHEVKLPGGDEIDVILTKGKTSYRIILEEFDHVEDIGIGSRLSETKIEYGFIKDHCGILDICLRAMQVSDFAPKIDDLYTDGDHKGCEASFRIQGEGYYIIKVR